MTVEDRNCYEVLYLSNQGNWLVWGFYWKKEEAVHARNSRIIQAERDAKRFYPRSNLHLSDPKNWKIVTYKITKQEEE